MMKLLVFALFALASAFNVAPLAVRRAPVAVTMGVAEIAANCLEEGCPIDMVAELIAELKDQSESMNMIGDAASDRNKEAVALIAQLEALNMEPVANKKEIEKVIGSAARTFA